MTAWQPRHDDPLFIMAMDHHASFGPASFGQQLIFDGLRMAAPELPRGRAGVIVDEHHGQAIIDEARHAPAERLGHWLSVACQVPAFTGFAIGRSSWQDVIRAYEASDRGDEAANRARDEIAARYLGFVSQWRP
jgi:myo-inositol catabolism protein IolC